MREKLTKRTVDAAKPGARDTFLWDTELKGFGLKITPAGKKVNMLHYRMGGRGAPTTRYPIGEHGVWTPDAARDRADKLLKLVDVGTDPAALDRETREADFRKQQEDAQRKERTFGAVVEDYLARRVRGKLVRDKQTESVLRRRFVTAWADRDIADITRPDVTNILEAMVDAGHAGAARKSLAEVRPVFAFAIHRGLITSNPASKQELDEDYKPRDRVLEDGELTEVWRAADAQGYPFGTMVKLLILTGQRLREVAEAQWAEFNLDEGTWTIPGPRTKNGKAHIVHLSTEAREVVDALPRKSIKGENLSADASATEEASPYLFTTTGKTPISGFSRAKINVEKAIAEDRKKAAKDAGRPAEAVSCMPAWALHDLRRTLATGCARLGIAPHVVEKVLNHNPRALKGVAGIYNRFEYLPERKAAIEAWGRHVTRVTSVQPAADNVVPLRA